MTNGVEKRLILVIGGTGAQGVGVVEALLAASFSVRVLSRDPSNPHVTKTFAKLPEVEFAKGSFMDFEAVRRSLEGCYGVYVNTDGFTVNEQDELWAGVRIWEIANTIPTLRHYIYAGIDYYLQLTGWDETYGAHHTNGKGRVNAYLQSQKSSTAKDGLTWTIINSAVYNEDLLGGPLRPIIDQSTGVRHIRLPAGNPSGQIPFVTLRDLGLFAEKCFSDRERWSGQTLNVVSHFATGPEIAEALSRAAGVKAVYENVPFETWSQENLGDFANAPLASTDPKGITWKGNFAMWWPGFQNSILYEKNTRNLEALEKILPEIESMEGWMKRVGFDGTGRGVLKGMIDAGVGPPAH